MIYIAIVVVIVLFAIVLPVVVVKKGQLFRAPIVFLSLAIIAFIATVVTHDHPDTRGTKQSYPPQRGRADDPPPPPWDAFILEDSTMIVTANEFQYVDGNIFWRIFRRGIVSGDKMTVGRVLMYDSGVSFDLAPYLIDPFNPTPAWIITWWLALYFLTRRVLPEVIKPKEGNVAAEEGAVSILSSIFDKVPTPKVFRYLVEKNVPMPAILILITLLTLLVGVVAWFLTYRLYPAHDPTTEWKYDYDRKVEKVSYIVGAIIAILTFTGSFIMVNRLKRKQ